MKKILGALTIPYFNLNTKTMENFKTKVKKEGGLENYWTKLISKKLVGAKIIKVEYMSKKEVENSMWHKIPVCLLMEKSNGKRFWMYPCSDDGYNDGGALATTMKDLPCTPTLTEYDRDYTF